MAAAAGLLGAVALHWRDPHVAGSWGICPTRLITGLDCPFCGSLRAVNLLTEGDLVGAASANLLLVVALPVVVVLWLTWLRRRWAGDRSAVWGQEISRPVWWVILGVALAFTIWRNLPAGAWLAA